MQSFKDDKLISTKTGELLDLLNVAEEINKVVPGAAHVIGQLPKRGSTVEIDKLQYKVTFVDKIYGKVHLKILKP